MVEQLIDIRVTNLAGKSIAAFSAVDSSSTTGDALKQMLVDVGFPFAAMRLSLPSAQTIMAGDPLSSVISAMLAENALAVTCLLVAPQPFGATSGGDLRSFECKGAIWTGDEITMAERRGKPIVTCLRTPDPALRQKVGPLIEKAIEAAYSKASAQDGADASRKQFIHENTRRGAYADLSACLLWTRKFKEGLGRTGVVTRPLCLLCCGVSCRSIIGAAHLQLPPRMLFGQALFSKYSFLQLFQVFGSKARPCTWLKNSRKQLVILVALLCAWPQFRDKA